MQKTIRVKKQGGNNTLFEQKVSSESIITVGNNPSATLELHDASVAPEQFVIISEENDVILMNRADGTIVNGKTLDLGSKIELNTGDEIEVGNFQLSFMDVFLNGADTSDEIGDKTEELPNISEKLPSETERDFSAVLNNLKEEDSFYFHIVDQANVVERVLFDSEDIWIGTSFAESAIKKDKTELDEIYAQVKKDWSGAVIYPSDSDELFLNGALLTEPSRLKNNDELVLSDDFAEEDETPTKITFHEPGVLLALNSILPEELPEPVSLKTAQEKNAAEIAGDTVATVGETKNIEVGTEKLSERLKNRRWFGYFSLLEIFIMAVGTFVTAAIVFLVLEFV